MRFLNETGVVDACDGVPAGADGLVGEVGADELQRREGGNPGELEIEEVDDELSLLAL